MKIYITGKGLSSAIGDGSTEITLPDTNQSYFAALAPDFTKYFDAKVARRTSKILKMSLVASFDALHNDYENIDGIIVGTGIGCISDSEKFITALINYNESMLSPTPFIQSTHNTIAGSIALQLKKHTYNFTYSERIFSFEWCLLDAIMHLQDANKTEKYLVGSADELTPNTFDMTEALHLNSPIDNNYTDIVNKKSNKVFAGEHAAFFTLRNSVSKDPVLSFVQMHYQKDFKTQINEIESALNGIKPDCILIGINGHQLYDKVYNPFLEHFSESSIAYFKHLCGESLTASSFAFWLALHILENKEVPELAIIKKMNKEIKNVLILNHLKKDYLSAIFISNE